MHLHLTLRARHGGFPFQDRNHARWVWNRLAGAYPRALACLLMGNHLHLVTKGEDPAGERAKLVGIALGSSRVFGGLTWLPIDEPQRVADSAHLRRLIRYVLLNPCRAGICADPLKWEWSTLRDSIGAIAVPWVGSEFLAREIGWRLAGFPESFHAWVCADSRVPVHGRAFPVAATPTEFRSQGLDTLALAACSALRRDSSQVKHRSLARKLFFRLARETGHQNSSEVARFADSAPSTAIRSLRRGLPRRCIDAGLLCLGDHRLRVSP